MRSSKLSSRKSSDMKSAKRIRMVSSRCKWQQSRFHCYITKRNIYNRKWSFHKYDADFSPSVLHGHSGKYKLDIIDGNVYCGSNKEPDGYARQKDLDALRHDKQFQDFAWERINWYRENFPKIPIEIPPWLKEPTVNRAKCITRKMRANEALVYNLKIIPIKRKRGRQGGQY